MGRDASTGVRGQLVGVSSLTPRESQGLISGLSAWWQMPYPVSHPSSTIFKILASKSNVPGGWWVEIYCIRFLLFYGGLTQVHMNHDEHVCDQQRTPLWNWCPSVFAWHGIL